MATDSTHQIPAFLRRRPASLTASVDASPTTTSTQQSQQPQQSQQSQQPPQQPQPQQPQQPPQQSQPIQVHVSKLPSISNPNTNASTASMPLPELPRSAVDPAMPLPVSDSTLPATPMPSASQLSSPAAPLPAPAAAAASPATTPPVPALDVNTIVFLQQQLERVVSFMRTVDARLDSLERTTLHLVSQQERLNKQLELRQQRPANTSLSSSGTGIGGAGSMGGAMVETGGICPLCGLHFADSNELQLHVQTCLDKRESRDRRSSSTGGSSGNQSGKDSGIFGRLLGKH